MAGYELSWITGNLAMGHAPMSYAELSSLREQGIGAIMNLCAEFCDLHEIEEKYGFEVYYLPVLDNGVPSEQELETALDWLDEAVYLGKKVLVHCRYGMGRTATFVAAYLLRKGFGLKLAKKKVEEARTMHSSFSQWRLLRKYSKKSGRLTIREPSLESRRIVDLSPFFHDYESLLERVDAIFRESAARNRELLVCGSETDRCCYEYLELSFVEAAYLSHRMNQVMSGTKRRETIDRAMQVAGRVKQIQRDLESGVIPSLDGDKGFIEAYNRSRILCPLNVDTRCEVHAFRPVACRTFGLAQGRRDGTRPASPCDGDGCIGADEQTIHDQSRHVLTKISANMLYALNSIFTEGNKLTFSLADTVSGRFVQRYFEFLTRLGPVKD